MARGAGSALSAGLAVAALLCLGGGFLLQRGRSDWIPLQRLLLASIPLAMLAIASWTAAVIAEIPFSDWSGARLASSASLLHGYRLYYGPDEGPAMPTVYGPVSVLLYLPALWTRSITGALLLAGSVNVLSLLLPLLLLHREHLRAGGWPRVAGLVGFAFAAAACLAASPTLSMLSAIHVDAPALGLGLSACMLLMRSQAMPHVPTLALSVLLAVLAVWTKQIEAPLILALLVWVAWRFGWRMFWQQVALFAVVGVGVSVAFALVFDFEAMFFNLFTIPSGHLQNFGVDGSALSFLDLALECAPFAAGIAGFAWLLRRQAGASPTAPGWLLPLLAAVFLFPVSAFARAKLGAWENSYHALYYLIAAASLLLAEALRSPARFAAPLAGAAATLAVLLAGVIGPGSAGLDRFGALSKSPQQQALDFARAHPGEAYFPWHPLASVYGEGRLYHFDYAVLDRQFAGYRMSDAHIRAFLPEDLRYVLFHRNRQDEAIMRRLPEFRARVQLEEMPDWIVYTKKPSAESR